MSELVRHRRSLVFQSFHHYPILLIGRIHTFHAFQPRRFAISTQPAPVPFAKWWLWNQIPVTLGNIVSATLFTGLPLFASYYRKPAQPIAPATLIDRPVDVAAAS